jgi:hypothetical protein
MSPTDRLAAMITTTRHVTALCTLLVLSVLAGCSAGPSATGTPAPTTGPSGRPSSTPATSTPSAAPTTQPTASPTSSPQPSGSIAYPTGASDLVLRVSTGGGLAGPAPAAQSIPGFSLYGDGRVIVEGPQIEIYPSPALPPLVQTQLTSEGVQRLLIAARGAGLDGPDRHFQLGNIADATTTVFIVVTADGRHTTSAYALHEASGFQDQMPNDERAARAALLRFESQLADLPPSLGPGNVGSSQPYAPTGMRIFSRLAQGPIDPAIPPQIQAWPLDDLATLGAPWPGAGSDMRCAVIQGDDLAGILPQLRGSNAITRWTSAKLAYQLTLRPMLPDESGCPGI